MDHRKLESLTPDEVAPLIATGFLRMAPDGTWSGAQNFVPERLDVVADQVEVLSSTVMGLTLACARCHDHKYDPLPQRDFYRFSAILRSAYDPYDWLIPQEPLLAPARGPFPKRLLRYGTEKELRQVKRNNGPVEQEIKRLKRSLEEKAAPFRKQLLQEKREKIPAALRADVEAGVEVAEDSRSELQKYLVAAFEEFLTVKPDELEKRFEQYREESAKVKEAVMEAEKKLQPHPSIRALFDMPGEPTPNYLLLRGEHIRPGDSVEPGIPTALRPQTPSLPYREAGLEQRAATGSGQVAGTARSPLDGPGDGEPYLATPFRQGPGGHARQLRQAGGGSIPSGTAGLAGHRVRPARLEREGHAPADHDLQRLPSVLGQRRR